MDNELDTRTRAWTLHQSPSWDPPPLPFVASSTTSRFSFDSLALSRPRWPFVALFFCVLSTSEAMTGEQEEQQRSRATGVPRHLILDIFDSLQRRHPGRRGSIAADAAAGCGGGRCTTSMNSIGNQALLSGDWNLLIGTYSCIMRGVSIRSSLGHELIGSASRNPRIVHELVFRIYNPYVFRIAPRREDVPIWRCFCAMKESLMHKSCMQMRASY